jgi:hypothetical protein
MLTGGDRRSIGQADLVVEHLIPEPARFTELWACLTSLDPVVRMRAADALEKFSRVCPAAFSAHKAALLARKLDDRSAEVRWHLIAITSRLELHPVEARHFARYLHDRLKNDPSKIVKVMALQAAKDVSEREKSVEDEFVLMLSFAKSSAWPSVAARARKIEATTKNP